MSSTSSQQNYDENIWTPCQRGDVSNANKIQQAKALGLKIAMSPPKRNGAEWYDLRPNRFVNGMEVHHKDDGRRLVNIDGVPIRDNNGRKVLNEFGLYTNYKTGNYKVDKHGNKILGNIFN